MASNTKGMDEHGNSKLPVKAAAEGSIAADEVAFIEHMTTQHPVSNSNLNGMNSHGDTVIPEKAFEANIDRHVHGLHPQSSKP